MIKGASAEELLGASCAMEHTWIENMTNALPKKDRAAVREPLLSLFSAQRLGLDASAAAYQSCAAAAATLAQGIQPSQRDIIADLPLDLATRIHRALENQAIAFQAIIEQREQEPPHPQLVNDTMRAVQVQLRALFCAVDVVRAARTPGCTLRQMSQLSLPELLSSMNDQAEQEHDTDLQQLLSRSAEVGHIWLSHLAESQDASVNVK
jgi:hypothetical protein